MSGARAGIYVHLPFCPYLCPYCDFAKWIADGAAQTQYLDALHAEIAATAPQPAATAFLGGGTPNVYPPAAVGRLVGALRDRFDLPDGAEITIELNPDLALCEGFGAYRAAGVSRLSIGAQSFDPRALRVLGRRHAPEDVATVVRRARAAGFENVSVDLIFGVPGQTAATWSATLDRALELEVEHISAYGLTIEPDTPYATWFAREPAAFVSNDLEAEFYELAIDRFGEHGYEQYEISNFARPGRRCAHNANYWAGGEYVGLGVGAAGYLGGERSIHTRDRAAYVAAARTGRPIPGDAERLEGAARLGEAVMLALRTSEGVELAGFAERYTFDVLDTYREELAEMQALELMEVSPTHVRLTRRGRMLANDVACRFVRLP